MRGAVVVAAIAAVPPTLAALLAFWSSRSSNRVAAERRAVEVAQSLDILMSGMARVESTVGRIEVTVIDLRERVARLEGAGEARTTAGA